MKRIIFVLLLILSLIPIVGAEQVDIYPTGDTFVDRDVPTANYGTATTSKFGESSRFLSYINFNTSSIPAYSAIDSATLNFYVSSLTGTGTYILQDVSSDWDEYTLTYNNRPTVGSTISLRNANTEWNYDIDITSLVTNWYNNAATNHGVGMYTSATLTTIILSRESATNKPYIRVTYHSVAVSPTNYSLSGYLKDFDTGIGINKAKILVTNNYSTYSEEIITNDQGFWNTSNLSLSFNVNVPSTFYVTASKIEEYEDSPAYPVTVSGSAPSWKNITLQKCVSGFNCFYNKQYVTFNTKYANGSTPTSGKISVYFNGNLETNGTIGSDGSTKILLFQTRYYYIVVNTPSASKSFYITPTSTIYNVVVGDIYGVLNDAKYYLSTSNTSIWFNTTDPNLELTNVTLQFGNATNTSINLTTMASSTARNFKFTPANITVPYKVTFTFVTQHYGNLSASRWVYITGAQPTLPAVTNLPAWGGNILAFVVSFVILFSTKGERNMGIGIFLMGLSLGIFAYLGVVSADISGTMLWQYSIPLICIIGVLTQMTRRN